MTAVRSRREGDVPALVALLQRTHDEQGYPVRQEAVAALWLALPEELSSWVAVDGATVLGHVALHPVHGACASLWATQGEVAVVSRLFTDGSVPGTGSALLSTAVDRATSLGRSAVLEVWVQSPAYGWYLRRGWVDLGRVDQRWGDVPVVVAAVTAPGRS